MINLFRPMAGLALLFMFATPGCMSQQEGILKGYDLSKHERFAMPESLQEISGISFHEGNSDTVYAIQDEEGKLFRLAWNVKKQYNTKFGKRGDYEDLSVLKDKVVVLKSNGSFYSFPFADAVYEEVDSVREWKHLLPEGEYEGIFGTAGKLYVLCKNCPGDNDHNSVSGYIFDAGDSIRQTGSFSIDVNRIKSFTGKVKRGFRPSGLALNPITNEWYIISAVNKLLIVTDVNWKITEVCRLDGNVFNQPEGICFDTKGNLYISNEGDDLSEGNILKFVRLAKH